MNKTLKSILSIVLCGCFVLALSACGKHNNDTTANNTDTNVSNNNVTEDNTYDSADITPEESTAGDSNILVAYFHGRAIHSRLRTGFPIKRAVNCSELSPKWNIQRTMYLTEHRTN